MGAFIPVIAALALSATPAPAASSPCKGPPARIGETVRGAIIHVPDGRHLCIAPRPDPASWTELEVDAAATWPAALPSDELSKAAVMSVAFTRNAQCDVAAAADGRPVARCRVDGAPLGELLAAPGALQRAAAWLPRAHPARPMLTANR